MRSDHLAKHVKTHENKVKKTPKKVKDEETNDKEKPQPKIIKSDPQISYLTNTNEKESLTYQTPFTSSNFVHPNGSYQKHLIYNSCYEQSPLHQQINLDSLQINELNDQKYSSVTLTNPNEAQIYHINTEINQNYQNLKSPMMYNYGDNQHMMNYMMESHVLSGDVLYK